MTSPVLRCLLVAWVSLGLAACAGKPPEPAPASAPSAVDMLRQNIASGELATAEDQLNTLQAQSPADPAADSLQRELAEAYLQRSQVSLQKGDVNAAATALARARALMPKAPALVGGVNGAITQARKAELEQAEAALKAAEAKPAAKVIDPAATSTPVALDTTHIRKMQAQLDDIATDVVNYNCDVVIQVPRKADAPWLEALLRKRVNKLNPALEWKLSHRVDRAQPAIVIVSPAKP
ncbi:MULTISPECIES: PA5502 family lipoprotein [unclassified Pseudomonas]|uniref:PA5502 family lipoprotein n=1 Tax=unclassified Pseudomonas TaxID=196821 RepID=UPI000BE25FAA|nr:MULTISPECIES: PA5502 family lipoprotein [unclassified Pseudomonas]